MRIETLPQFVVGRVPLERRERRGFLVREVFRAPSPGTLAASAAAERLRPATVDRLEPSGGRAEPGGRRARRGQVSVSVSSISTTKFRAARRPGAPGTGGSRRAGSASQRRGPAGAPRARQPCLSHAERSSRGSSRSSCGHQARPRSPRTSATAIPRDAGRRGPGSLGRHAAGRGVGTVRKPGDGMEAMARPSADVRRRRDELIRPSRGQGRRGRRGASCSTT